MTSVLDQNSIDAAQVQAPARARASFNSHIRDYGMLIALVAILSVFAVATNGAVLMPLNITNVILQNSYIIIMSLGMMLVIVAGRIDLSVGSTVAFIGALAAVLIVQHQVPPLKAGLACLLAGAFIGAAQGYLVAYCYIPSFIVTLGGMLIFRGLSLALLGGASIGPFPASFQQISSGFIPDVLSGFVPDLFNGSDYHITTMALGIAVTAAGLYFARRERKEHRLHQIDSEPAFAFWARSIILAGFALYIVHLLASYRGLPNVAVLMFILVAVFSFVSARTTFGRRVYALGGNEKAAQLSGINTKRLVLLTFAILGALAALAGLVFAARLNVATPKAGVSFELDVIAACFIGGASASGGVGKVTGAVIGAFVMGIMNNGLSILGVGIDWQQVIKGSVLLLAVFFDVSSKKRV
jgi:putative multiple sugar transport system permease protein